MSHVAFVAPPFLGHLDPMLALAASLRARGNRVTLFGIAEVAPVAARHGCAFEPLGRGSHSAGSLDRIAARMAAPGGLGLGRVMRDMAGMTAMLCAELPGACRRLGVDGIVSDQLEPAGSLVAAHLGLPYVTVANALPIHREPAVPPPFTGWRYDASPWGMRRNRGGYRVADWLMRGVTAGIAGEAERLGVPALGSLERCLSPYADITQLVPQLDFPRHRSSATVHPCGPLRQGGADVDVSDLCRDGRPLVFASLGSLQGGRAAIFAAIARACTDLGLHLVVAHGGRLDPATAATLPGAPTVRAFVPQRSLLRHADLLITNGGLNTVLDAAVAGVPMLVMPIAFEQAATAARVAHAGLGTVLSRHRLGRLRGMVAGLIGDASRRPRARAVAQALAGGGGAEAAADVVEAVLRTGRPVLRGQVGRRAAPLLETA